MPKTNLNIIKPALGVTAMSDNDLLGRLHAVQDGTFNNPAYPNPTVDAAAFKAAIDAYSTAASAALDGGKSAILERDKRRADAVIMFRLLGHYVEVACKGDEKTFNSSGFIAAVTHPRTPAQPVAIPSILKIDQGASGTLLVTIQPVAGARSYELRSAAVPPAGGNANWTTILVASSKPATPVNNLTPGTAYLFQVRAFGKLGFSEWSNSAQRMSI